MIEIKKDLVRENIYLTIGISLISSKGNDEERLMNSKSDNIEIVINDADEADEVIKELFESLQNRYQNNLLESMKFSDFVFNCLQLLYYKYHEINFERGR